ncbi:MAG: cyclohexanecarboxylate-CoA ligase [Frankiales bacterium]|jgi:cyclohexanecarboxylate-CoA ligase|nr:cyclohexanecarboxylate-CoA ligase [Frankiales bacterium]
MASAALTTLADLPAPRVVDGQVRLHAIDLDEQATDLAKQVEAGTYHPFVAHSHASTIATFLACWRGGATAAPLHSRLTDAEQLALQHRIESLPPDPKLAVVLATSGSSGRPKLVLHASDRLAYKARLMADVHALTTDDVVLMPAPLAHVSGLLNGVLVPAAAGMTTVLMSRWSPEDALDLVEREHVTFMIGPPTYFVQMMGSPRFSAERVASVRLISCGGAGVTPEFAQRAADTFSAVVKRTYGSTEAPTITTSFAGDPMERGWTTDGRAVGDVELRLDPASDELLVRGRELFTSYGDPEMTATAVDSEGWFRTGDRGRIDGDWLIVLGRLGDTIIRGGENVDPREVESVCASLAGVAQVVVVGYPDDEMGERVGLVVVGREPTIDEVRAHCAAGGLARFKTPERVVEVSEMPILTVGKPDRVALTRLFTIPS